MEKRLRTILKETLLDMGVSNSMNDQSLSEPVDIEVPRDESLGDLSTPVAMKLARSLRKDPKVIATEIKDRIISKQDGLFDKIEVAGQGFINFIFTKMAIYSELKALLQQGISYFVEDLGHGKRVQIEFVSANPTGPLHLGHGRGAAVGMALANLLTAMGYEVEREYYINDAGVQIERLGQSVFARYRQVHCSQSDYPFPEDGYRGEYISEMASRAEFLAIAEKYRLCEVDYSEASSVINELSCSLMLREIKRDLNDFGIVFDTWQSEKTLYESGSVQATLEHLRSKGLVYASEGAHWFKSTAFGDDKDRVVIKQDGQYTYFASDIAYHKQKLDKGFDEIIDLWGADHHGYISRVSAVLQGLGLPAQSFKVLLIQLVNLLRDGRPIQMSKRAGEFVTLREVIDEIGTDTTKFLFLTRRHDTPLDIDVEKAKAQSSDNPVYYVQYAHARINSILKKAADTGLDVGQISEELSLNEDELRLLKKCLTYPMVLRSAAIAREPHRIAFYLQELAALFHPYYHRHRVITEDEQTTFSRLGLCKALKAVISHGLGILGVTAPDRM